MVLADWVLVDEALAHAAQAVQQQPRPAFTTLTPDEAATLDAMSARILPTTETPGAREAGAVYFMDKAFGTFAKDELASARKQLADLAQRVRRKKGAGVSFAKLAPADQDAILKEIEKDAFFEQVRFFTMVGTFGNPSYGGNRNQVGWKLLGFEMKPTYQPPFGYYDAQLMRGGRS